MYLKTWAIVSEVITVIDTTHTPPPLSFYNTFKLALACPLDNQSNTKSFKKGSQSTINVEITTSDRVIVIYLAAHFYSSCDFPSDCSVAVQY